MRQPNLLHFMSNALLAPSLVVLPRSYVIVITDHHF